MSLATKNLSRYCFLFIFSVTLLATLILALWPSFNLSIHISHLVPDITAQVSSLVSFDYHASGIGAPARLPLSVFFLDLLLLLRLVHRDSVSVVLFSSCPSLSISNQPFFVVSSKFSHVNNVLSPLLSELSGHSSLYISTICSPHLVKCCLLPDVKIIFLLTFL